MDYDLWGISGKQSKCQHTGDDWRWRIERIHLQADPPEDRPSVLHKHTVNKSSLYGKLKLRGPMITIQCDPFAFLFTSQ